MFQSAFGTCAPGEEKAGETPKENGSITEGGLREAARFSSEVNKKNTRFCYQNLRLPVFIFCLRNLAKVLKVPLKAGRKKKGRKRPRDDSLGPRVEKQQCLHSSHLAKRTSDKIPVAKSDRSGLDQSSGQSTSSGFYGWSEQEMDGPDSAHRTAELMSSSVNVQESLKPQEVRVKLKAQKKTAAGFRDLLAQMRTNASVIFREPCP